MWIDDDLFDDGLFLHFPAVVALFAGHHFGHVE